MLHVMMQHQGTPRTMTSDQIRRALDKDRDAIADLLTEAFGRPDEARLVETLEATGDLAHVLVAEASDGLAGVAVFSHLRAPPNSLALGPIAVAPDHRHKGLGQDLIHDGIAWARAESHAGIFVLGRPRFYTRAGLTLETAARFDCAYPKEFMLGIELSPDALPDTGSIRFAPAFAALG
jgi:putative acetyltransferase